MIYRATAKFVRMSPRKTRLLVDLVRGLSVEEARRQLMFSKRAAAKPVLKVLESAIANAKNNYSQDTSDFIIVKAFVNEGPSIKRYKPRAHGRATPIRKRMSHITIEVGKKGGEKAEKKVEKSKVKTKITIKEKKAVKQEKVKSVNRKSTAAVRGGKKADKAK